MKIPLRLILITCIVNFCFESVQPNGKTDQYQNLFDSIGNNHVRTKEIDRKILTQKEAQERRTFYAMKDELQIARRKNSLKLEKSYRKIENVAIYKRNANEDPDLDISPVISSTNTGIEDHSNAKQSSSSSIVPQPAGQSSLSTNTDMENHSNAKQSPSLPIVSQPGQTSPSTNTDVKVDSNVEQSSSSLPIIPEPDQSFYYVKTQKGEKYAIVDKTDFIRKLIDNNSTRKTEKIYSLTRPKTFGKTFFLSTVHAFLDGKADIFKGTAIGKRGNSIKEDGKWTQHPVILINFSDLVIETVGAFRNTLRKRINAIAEQYGISTKNRGGIIRWLIQELKSKFNFRVSILIDEFDAPLTVAAKRRVLLEGLKMELEFLYWEIKAAASASELWLVLILGVNKLNVFNKLNGFVKDITFDDQFSSIMGFLPNEIEEIFKPHLDEFSKKEKWDTSDTAKKIENRFGGYRFSKENRHTRVLDPGSVCLSLSTFKIASDFEPKTEALENIVKRMEKERMGVHHFKYLCIEESELEKKYDTEKQKNIPLYMVMLYTGYLTIKTCRPNRKEVCLSYPNEGIEKRIERSLPVKMRSREPNQTYREPYRLALNELFQDALDQCNMMTFVDLLISEAFPIVSHSLRFKVSKDDKEFVGTRFIFQTLNTLKLDVEEGILLHSTKDGRDAGDLDLVIYAVEKNMPHYAISSKGKKGPFEAVSQLMEYVVTKNVEFDRKFKNKPETNVINLLGLVIKNDEDRHKTISEWILVPYTRTDRKIWINETEASSTSIKLSLSKWLKDQTYFEAHKDFFFLEIC